MGDTLASLTPLIIGSAVVPLQIITIILLLKSSSRGLAKGIAFYAGMAVTRVLQGVLFGLVLFSPGATADSEGGKSPVVSTLLLVLGILLLISAYKKWKKEEDPDDAPPKWLASIDNMSAMTSLLFGMALPMLSPKLWVFTLSAIGAIGAGQLGQPLSAAAYLIFVLLAQSLLLLPILIRIIFPKQSKSWLEAVSSWLERNSTTIVMVVSLVFGLYFLYQGASGLL